MYCLGPIAYAIDKDESNSCEEPTSSQIESPPKKKKRNANSMGKNKMTFNGQLFQIFPIHIAVPQFMEDIRKSPMFRLQIVPERDEVWNKDEQYLSVFFDPNYDPKLMLEAVRSKYRLLERFFNLPTMKEIQPKLNEHDWEMASASRWEMELHISENSIRELYTQLRLAHSTQTVEVVVSKENPPLGLVPELRCYQEIAVNWMLKKERVKESFPTEFVQVKMRKSSTKPFFFNPRTLVLLDKMPDDLQIPTGGILADEMGLGKTVEMLALILSNKRLMEELNNKDQSVVVASKVGKILLLI